MALLLIIYDLSLSTAQEASQKGVAEWSAKVLLNSCCLRSGSTLCRVMWWGYRIGLQARNKSRRGEMLWGSCLRCCSGLHVRCQCRLNMPGARKLNPKKTPTHNIELYSAWFLCLRPWIAIQDSLRHLHFVQCVGKDKHLKNVFIVSSIVCGRCLEAIHKETWKKGMFLNAFLFLKSRHVDSMFFPAKVTFVLRTYKASKRKSKHIFLPLFYMHFALQRNQKLYFV